MFIYIYVYIYNRTKVECAGLCLSTTDCHGFEWINSGLSCRMMLQSGLCLDNQKKKPVSIYVDQDNMPPICPGNKPFYF